MFNLGFRLSLDLTPRWGHHSPECRGQEQLLGLNPHLDRFRPVRGRKSENYSLFNTASSADCFFFAASVAVAQIVEQSLKNEAIYCEWMLRAGYLD